MSVQSSPLIRVSLTDFLNWAGLPDLPAQPDRLWEEKTYPAGNNRGGSPCKIKVELYYDSSLRILQTSPLGGGTLSGSDMSIECKLLFNGFANPLDVAISNIHCITGDYRDLDWDAPDLRQIKAATYAISLAMQRKPIGSADNPWEDIESGVNADRLDQNTSGRGSDSDIMRITRQMCP